MNSIIITLLRLFSSCPGILHVSGKILSEKNDLPIEGAQIELLDIKQTAQASSLYMSDKNGNFTASSIMRKMIFGFPAYHIKITKKGFQILERKLDLKGKNGPIVYKLIEE